MRARSLAGALGLCLASLAAPAARGASLLLLYQAADCAGFDCSGIGVAAVDEATGARLADVIRPQSGPLIPFGQTGPLVDDRCDLLVADQRFQGETGDYVGLLWPIGKDHLEFNSLFGAQMVRPGEVLLDDLAGGHLSFVDQTTGALEQTLDLAALGLPCCASAPQLLDDQVYFAGNVDTSFVTGFRVGRLDAATRAADPAFHLQILEPTTATLALRLLALGRNSAGELVAFETITDSYGHTAYRFERFDAHTGAELGVVGTQPIPADNRFGLATFFDGVFYTGSEAFNSGDVPQVRRYAADTGMQIAPSLSFPDAVTVFPPSALRTCVPDNRALLLHGGRFAITATFSTPDGGHGDARAAASRSDDSGQLWFFSKSNAELSVKVLDGCASSGHFWVYAAGMTDLAVDLTVTDTTTGRHAVYSNAAGHPFELVRDTATFDGCE